MDIGLGNFLLGDSLLELTMLTELYCEDHMEMFPALGSWSPL